jgi:hypothetical protein
MRAIENCSVINFEESRTLHSKYTKSVIDICEFINGSIRGTGDSISTEKLQEIVDWLEDRINYNWDLSSSTKIQICAYDFAVRNLALCAIALGKNELSQRSLEE